MKSIGIVGGAGPRAGILLFEKIFEICQEVYKCNRDFEFPKIILINVPFSEMLMDPNVEVISEELEGALAQLENNGCDLLGIACNTLHGFMKKPNSKLINITSVIPEKSSLRDDVLVLCSSTSRDRGVYNHIVNKRYLSTGGQLKLDRLIDGILKGNVTQNESMVLSKLIKEESKGNIILGCTELSYLHALNPLRHPYIIDPLSLLAQELCRKTFE